MPCSLVIVLIAIKPKVLDDQTVFWQPEVRVIKSDSPSVDYFQRVFILVSDAVSIEKPGYLLFTPTLIRWFNTIYLSYSLLLHDEKKVPGFLILSVSSKIPSHSGPKKPTESCKSCYSAPKMLTSVVYKAKCSHMHNLSLKLLFRFQGLSLPFHQNNN